MNLGWQFQKDIYYIGIWASLVAQMGTNPPAVWET